MNLAPASLGWFARHEFGLAWRDWLAMATGGKRGRAVALTIAAVLLAIFLHLLANGLVAPWAAAGIVADKQTLVLVTGIGVLFWTVMLSQTMESATRAYYGRSDFDLILSSPAPAARVFAVRTIGTALATVTLAGLLASPLINALAFNDGPHWLAAYPLLAALGALATAISVLVVIGLFKLVGAKRARLVAQIVAGIVGAGFVIGIQAAAIMAYGNMTRLSLLQSVELAALAPEPDSPVWLPARAAMGEPGALLLLAVLGFGALGLVIALTAPGFARHAVAAASVATAAGPRQRHRSFRPISQTHALRRKEWMLLRRDPWLLSQTLMQMLYLVPPALLLWVNFGATSGMFIVVVPVLVMASGQLAGGLAWLAVSGEDAHDLVLTAPLAPRAVLTAKIQAVLAVIAVVLAPLLALMALSSPPMAAVTAVMAALSAGSATAIQLWFRTPMRRSMFRRRQVASRLATISEAFASIMWAGAAALLAAGSWIALMAVAPALLACGIVALAWFLSPRGRTT
jgi:ABC-2 type transport system permease protein